MAFRPEKVFDFDALTTQLASSGEFGSKYRAAYQTIFLIIKMLRETFNFFQAKIAELKNLIDNNVVKLNLSDATYLTATDETPRLPFSRQLVAGTGITLDLTTPGQEIINATGTATGDEVFLTGADESATLPNSRELLAGTGINFDDTTPGERTIETTGLSPDDATYLTEDDESASLPNSRQVLAGSGIEFDDTVANERTIFANLKGARVTFASNATGQDFTTLSPIIWDTEVFDNGGFWTSSGGIGARLTVPEDGIYEFYANALIQDLTNGVRVRIYIQVDGTTAYAQQADSGTLTSSELSCSTGPIPLSAGQYARMLLIIQTDTSVTITAVASNFSVTQVGKT